MPFKTLARMGKPKTKIEKQLEAAKKIKEVREEKPNYSDAVLSVIKSRRSVRKYSNKDVSDSLIEKILEAASSAPSAGNRQPWEFIVVKDFETRKALTEASFDQKWMIQAPIFIVVCVNTRIAAATYGERGDRLYGVQGTAAAIQNMLLAAEALGLSACWVGAFSEPHVSVLAHCPSYARPCAIITLGYGLEKPKMPLRQPMEEIVHRERFGTK